MAESKWFYEKLDENGIVRRAPMNDADAKITGRHVFGLRAWFDENPEERIRLGYVKHITHDPKEIEHDSATQYLIRSVKTVDEYTVEDEYRVMEKTPEMMRLGETYLGWDNWTVIGGEPW